MPANDTRGHTVPADSDAPNDSAFKTLSLSINDPIEVANTTARASTAAALSPTSSLPVYTWRADAPAGAQLEVTTDGVNWSAIVNRTTGTWTPVWGASSTNPTLNNGTLVGTYTQDDRYIDFEVTLTVGSTSAVGSGNYTLTLPVAALSTSGRKMFTGNLIDISAGNIYTIVGQVIGGTTTMNLTNGGFPLGNLTAAAPVVPASGDIYTVAGRYRWA